MLLEHGPFDPGRGHVSLCCDADHVEYATVVICHCTGLPRTQCLQRVLRNVSHL